VTTVVGRFTSCPGTVTVAQPLQLHLKLRRAVQPLFSGGMTLTLCSLIGTENITVTWSLCYGPANDLFEYRTLPRTKRRPTHLQRWFNDYGSAPARAPSVAPGHSAQQPGRQQDKHM
jgi:hypothetical protein